MLPVVRYGYFLKSPNDKAENISFTLLFDYVVYVAQTRIWLLKIQAPFFLVIHRVCSSVNHFWHTFVKLAIQLKLS